MYNFTEAYSVKISKLQINLYNMKASFIDILIQMIYFNPPELF